MSIRGGTSQKRKKGKIGLKIGVEDFGPISGGEITLKPLTLFIGPNNSGKSYAAMLIHSIFESYLSSGDILFLIMRGRSWKEFPELKSEIGDLKEGKELDIPKQFIETITNKIFVEIYQRRLSDEVVRSFSCPLDELVKIGKNSFVLRIK